MILAEYLDFRVYLLRFDENSKSMDPGYPQDVENWRGVPRNIDAVFTSVFDGRTYFFKGGIHKLHWQAIERGKVALLMVNIFYKFFF